MPAKMARSAPRPPFRLPEITVAVCTSRWSCSKVGKAQIFKAVPETSGKSQLKHVPAQICFLFSVRRVREQRCWRNA
jgi:hypothetical protein